MKGVKPIRKKRPDGSVSILYYHRATMLRLPDDPDSLAFKIAFDSATRQFEEARSDVKTLSWLIRAYQASDDWRGLSDKTKENELFNLRAVEAEFGTLPLKDIEERGARAVFLEWRDELAERHPRAADAKLARLAKVLSFGLDREHVSVNPLATFRRVYDGDRSDKLWLPEHVEAFNAKAHEHLRVVLTLALHTGQRQGDLLALRWTAYDGEAISLKQSKTGAEVYIPCTAALRETLDGLRKASSELPEGAPGRDFVLVNSVGKPWVRTAFSTAWDRAFDLAFPRLKPGEKGTAPPDLHFHDLRGTAVTMLAEAGCTVPEIASITGHTLSSVTKILERYLSRTKMLARSAIEKLEKRMKVA
ncbi:hypothetical protein PMNALOAF_2696 [Methylobacterium adhaesivum]|uniref:Tyrosine-type recombinase/integrase n=1 Tax=Methylobacterium adhaesivum TaxID=333297 RepID=A0ABT8BL78_9HYPH|nr:tyrosine-type recombinase/integrase [Methylobacterium adhaesivum]MDN3592050.1 tyrosine-type recombinase/integrase [Methylobacterium adhaesivum]GJD31437.1 hypothetical protein PMNALOAF_2696 [Methylobacterium adhaesivum]